MKRLEANAGVRLRFRAVDRQKTEGEADKTRQQAIARIVASIELLSASASGRGWPPDRPPGSNSAVLTLNLANRDSSALLSMTDLSRPHRIRAVRHQLSDRLQGGGAVRAARPLRLAVPFDRFNGIGRKTFDL